jgi:hypothetical protein
MENIDALFNEIKTNILIQHLKEYNLENTHHKEIYNLIDQCSIPFHLHVNTLEYSEKDIYFVYRMVKNNSEKFLTTVERISYPPLNRINNFGRCNSEKQQVFYGAFELRQSCDIIIVNPISVCTNECQIKENEIVTIGAWRVIKSFDYYIVFPTNREIKHIEEFKKQYNEKNILMSLNDFLRDEMGKVISEGEEYKYKITAAFSNIIFNKGHNIKAILYPSTKLGDGIGYNIVFRKEAIDNNYLQLQQVVTFKFVNGQLHPILEGTINDDGTIDYTEIENI